MHDSAFRDAQRFVERYLQDRPTLRIADFGSMDVNGSLRPLFQRHGWTYHGFDQFDGPNVNHVLSNADDWPEISDNRFDVVVSSQKLEHVKRPWKWMSELARICIPGGLIYVCSPNTWPYHAYPIDCWRIWPEGLEGLFEDSGLETLETYAEGTDTTGVARRLTNDTQADRAKTLKINVLCITCGRDTLRRTLQSLQRQVWNPQDEVWLVHDGPPDETIRRLWAEARLPGQLRFLGNGPHRDWGYTPRNSTLLEIEEGYVVNLDDDDVLPPYALEVVRRGIRQHPNAFFLYRAQFPDGRMPWVDPSLHEGNVGTAMFVHPTGINYGTYNTNRYCGDFDFIESTIAKNPDRRVIWCEETTYIVRPHEKTINPNFVDLAQHCQGIGREDCQSGWQEFFGRWFQHQQILDVGSGLGHSKPRLAAGGNQVTLHDVAPGLAVDLCCPLTDIEDGAFDVVTAFDVIEHVPNEESFVLELARLAKFAIVITTPNLWVFRCVNRHHIREYSPPSLLDLAWSVPGMTRVQMFGSHEMNGSNCSPVTGEAFLKCRFPVLAIVIWKQPGDLLNGPIATDTATSKYDIQPVQQRTRLQIGGIDRGVSR